jgi:hypothetical protein
MATKKLGDFATPNDYYLRVNAENYETKPNFLNLVQHNQFGGSASEDIGMQLNIFIEIWNLLKNKSTSALGMNRSK